MQREQDCFRLFTELTVCRQEGSFQLIEGWKAFAQCWDLGHGEQLQLSRRFVSNGCVWLNVTLVVNDQVAKQAMPGNPSCDA